MLNSPDTLQVLIIEFASEASESTASESMVLGLFEFALSLWFLQPELNYFKHLMIVF